MNGEKRSGILNGSADLQPIANDAGIGEQLLQLALIVPRDGARIEIVERLLNSLDKPDPEIDKAWADESERRLDEYLAGGVAARDAEEVLAKYLKP